MTVAPDTCGGEDAASLPPRPVPVRGARPVFPSEPETLSTPALQEASGVQGPSVALGLGFLPSSSLPLGLLSWDSSPVGTAHASAVKAEEGARAASVEKLGGSSCRKNCCRRGGGSSGEAGLGGAAWGSGVLATHASSSGRAGL